MLQSVACHAAIAQGDASRHFLPPFCKQYRGFIRLLIDIDLSYKAHPPNNMSVCYPNDLRVLAFIDPRTKKNINAFAHCRTANDAACLTHIGLRLIAKHLPTTRRMVHRTNTEQRPDKRAISKMKNGCYTKYARTKGATWMNKKTQRNWSKCGIRWK